MTKPQQFRTNALYYYANQYRKKPTTEEEIEQIDMTDIFYRELEQMIQNGEIIIININSKMRVGKSTEAIALGQHIFKLLQKNKQRKPEDKFTLKANVARDHQEHSKLMRNPKTSFTVIVTDESNELEYTGENVTVEQALTKTFSDVHAGRYVHRVCCSPKEIIDPNADILLHATSIDKRTRITHNKLYYRHYEGGTEYIQLLGYVDIYVGALIQIWEEKVKKRFNKPKKSPEDQEIIEKYTKTDLYTEYITKKYEKMELITKEGIFKPRILDYAEVILKVIERLKNLARLTSIINQNVTRNYIKIEMRKAKIPQSIIGEELATREATGLLDLYKAYHKLNSKIKTLDAKKMHGAVSPEAYTYQNDELIQTREELLAAIKIQEDELQRYAEINKKYHNHENDT